MTLSYLLSEAEVNATLLPKVNHNTHFNGTPLGIKKNTLLLLGVYYLLPELKCTKIIIGNFYELKYHYFVMINISTRVMHLTAHACREIHRWNFIHRSMENIICTRQLLNSLLPSNHTRESDIVKLKNWHWSASERHGFRHTWKDLLSPTGRHENK